MGRSMRRRSPGGAPGKPSRSDNCPAAPLPWAHTEARGAGQLDESLDERSADASAPLLRGDDEVGVSGPSSVDRACP